MRVGVREFRDLASESLLELQSKPIILLIGSPCNLHICPLKEFRRKFTLANGSVYGLEFTVLASILCNPKWKLAASRLYNENSSHGVLSVIVVLVLKKEFLPTAASELHCMPRLPNPETQTLSSKPQSPRLTRLS